MDYNKGKAYDENSLKDNKEVETNEMKENNLFIFSNESFKNKSILKDDSDITYYNQDFTLFEKKDFAKELFERMAFDENISIEDILSYDNTNQKAQKKYLNLAVNLLLKENDSIKKLMLIEKIQKSSIILDENEYNQEIYKLPNELQDKVKYNNYKKILINLLGLISDTDMDDNLNEVIECFHFKIRYEFNQEAVFGENNYYFYCLVQQLYSDNLFYINDNIKLYKDFIIKAKNFLLKETDFSTLNKKKRDYFEYLINILVDEKFLEDIWQKIEIENYLDSFGIDNTLNKNIEEKKNFIQERNSKNNDNENYTKELKSAIEKLNNIIQSDEEINYIFGMEHNELFVDILDNRKVSRKKFNKKERFKYNIQMFNKGILNIIEKELTYKNYFSFDSLLLRTINYGYEEKFIESSIDKFKEIIKKILKSEAAERFFNFYYKDKYKDLNYHFNQDKVIEEIFRRIKFVPLFNKNEKVFTSTLELKIYMNIIPGSFNNYHIRIFERKIMQIGRLIISAIHEIMGHFLRRYYSFLTNNKVKFNTKEDNVINMKPESGNFVEREFLGILYSHSISFNESIEFFKKDFKTFPIISQENLELKDLRNIIENNKDYFGFISNDNNNGYDTIEINTFQVYLMKGFNINTKIISCGFRKENAIFLN